MNQGYISFSVQFHFQERGRAVKPVGNNCLTGSFLTILKILVRVPLPSPALAFLALADCDFWSPWRGERRRRCVKRALEIFARGLADLSTENLTFIFNSVESIKKSQRVRREENITADMRPTSSGWVEMKLLRYNCVQISKA